MTHPVLPAALRTAQGVSRVIWVLYQTSVFGKRLSQQHQVHPFNDSISRSHGSDGFKRALPCCYKMFSNLCDEVVWFIANAFTTRASFLTRCFYDSCYETQFLHAQKNKTCILLLFSFWRTSIYTSVRSSFPPITRSCGGFACSNITGKV